MVIAKKRNSLNVPLVMEIPTRSRLYSLAPLEKNTLEVESFTSYVARLAWAYRVGPRDLVVQEIIPQLKMAFLFHENFERLGSYCRRNAMTINGAGETSQDWTNALEQLTMRDDLRYLTLQSWGQGFAPRGLLRSAPAWCPTCYWERREKLLPLYQPLLWMLQVVMICPRHKRLLQAECPFCSQLQSVLSVKTQHRFCTQCTAWLGTPLNSERSPLIDTTELVWHEWVLQALEELLQAGTHTGPLPWERLLVGFRAYIDARGGIQKCADLAGMHANRLSLWFRNKVTPTLSGILEICYVLDISPLQLMMTDLEGLRSMGQSSNKMCRTPWLQRPARHLIESDKASSLLQEVIDGREIPLSVFEIERRLGLKVRTLHRRFPQECTSVTALYRSHLNTQSKQKSEQRCEELRRIMLSLHMQGMYPSAYLIAQLHSNPHIMRKPDGKATWEAVLCELGLAKGYKKKAKKDQTGR